MKHLILQWRVGIVLSEGATLNIEAQRTMRFLFVSYPSHLLWLIHTFFCCAPGLYAGRGVAVGAKCYFYCKPHCNNNMRNPMKVELITVPRPPASSCWRSQNWSRVEADGNAFVSEGGIKRLCIWKWKIKRISSIRERKFEKCSVREMEL